MFDTNSPAPESEAETQDAADMAVVMRICAEDDQRRAAAGLPPFAESTDAEDEFDPYGITCQECERKPTHEHGGYAWCGEHAPKGAEEAVF